MGLTGKSRRRPQTPSRSQLFGSSGILSDRRFASEWNPHDPFIWFYHLSPTSAFIHYTTSLMLASISSRLGLGSQPPPEWMPGEITRQSSPRRCSRFVEQPKGKPTGLSPAEMRFGATMEQKAPWRKDGSWALMIAVCTTGGVNDDQQMCFLFETRKR